MSYYREKLNRAFGMRRYGLFLEELGRVTDAEFEVIEPTTEQHGTEQSAGDGIQYDYTGTDRPTAGTGTGISGHTFGTITTT